MASIQDYLSKAVYMDASDLFAVAGAPVSVKMHGNMIPIADEKLVPPTILELIKELYGKAGRSMDVLEKTGDDDFAFALPGLARFRVNAYRQRGSYALVIRIVLFEIPDYRSISIPEQIIKFSTIKHGMILFTGTAGSGKSTTEACLIDKINHTRACHIITLEDPIEFLHRNDKSIVSQREIAIDTENFSSALRACLRQAPDVILLGEMRDQETISAAVTAAETGHLVVATLHTNGAVNAIDRIVDTFPSQAQQQIRIQLANLLQSVVSQQLLPDTQGGRVPAFEIMNNNSAIRNMIRESKTHQIDTAIITGSQQGMISMDQAIFNLYQERRITSETALNYCVDPEQMKRRI